MSQSRRQRVPAIGFSADDELVAVWRAAERMGGPFGIGVRLLVATAGRRQEIFGLRWSEIDRDQALIRLPAERNKVAEERVIPLSPLASSLLDQLPRLGACAVTTTGAAPYANISDRRAALDIDIARHRAEIRLGRSLADGEEPEATDWLARGDCTTSAAPSPPACSGSACGWR